MRKLLTVLLIGILACSFAFAASPDFENGEPYVQVGKKMYQPTNVRLVGMGNAGLAFEDNAEGLFVNPAALGAGKFQMSAPSVAVTAYHVYDIFEGGADSTFCKIAEEVQKDEINYGKIIDEVIGVVGKSYTSIVSADAAASMILPNGLGIGVALTDTVHTYDGSIMDEVNVSAALGYGFGLDLGFAKLNLGAVAKMNVLMFDETITTGDALAMMNEEKSVEDTPVAVGYAIPFDFGAQLVFPFGLSVGATCANVNGDYNMAVTTVLAVEDLEEDDFNAFVIKSKPMVSAGVAYEKKGVFNTRFAADIVDVVSFVDEYADCDAPVRLVMKHLNAGAEINLVNTLAVRAGISQGYMSVGATFNLMLMRVDAAYYWKEMGDAAGQNGLDAFTIRFNLGFEK